ncbi:unnamed protein product, partial [Laminaria digitata]
AEEALDALCRAVDPCLMVQPVASLAQYGNARLKVRITQYATSLNNLLSSWGRARVLRDLYP